MEERIEQLREELQAVEQASKHDEQVIQRLQARSHVEFDQQYEAEKQLYLEAIAALEEDVTKLEAELQQLLDQQEEEASSAVNDDLLLSSDIEDLLFPQIEEERAEAEELASSQQRKRKKGDVEAATSKESDGTKTKKKRQSDNGNDPFRALLSVVTGLSFTHHSTRLTTTNAGVFIRKYKTQGHSFGIPFEVLFSLSEEHPQAQDLKIRVPTHVRRELSPLLSRVESTGAVLEFFQQFGEYAEQYTKRKYLFNKLQRRHGDAIYLPCGECSSFCCIYPVKPRSDPSLLFVWSLEFTTSDPFPRLRQTINLLPKASKQCMEEAAWLLGLPQRFAVLAKRKGIAEALLLVCSLALQPASAPPNK
ncbi:hypothetical protein QOT17_022697 [Balamuthia mandrillaris]